jgi:excisionase family DNA binding protein
MAEVEDPFMSTVSIAEMFDVTPYTVRQWVREGKLKATKVNRSWKVRRSEAVRFANEKYN